MSETFRDLVDLCDRSCAKHAKKPLFGTKAAGAWRWTSYEQFHSLVERFRGGLASLGVGQGDRVAIVSENRVEWAVAAYATYGLGASFVPMYPAQRPEEWEFILRDCDAKVVIGSTATHAALVTLQGKLPALEHVIGLDRAPTDPCSWSTLVELGGAAPVPAIVPDPKSVCDFVYTSGTTGKPKGVKLSHANIASNVSAVHQVYTFEPDDVSLSFLPWAHMYGQMEVHAMLSMGVAIAINDDLPNLVPNLAEVKPTLLFAVPRIFNRLYEGVTAQIESRPGFLQGIIHGGIDAALKQAHGEKLGMVERAELAFDERVVFSKIRERLGGRLRLAMSASATLGREVAELIDAMGVPVYEGYGLTETSPIVSANYPGVQRRGSVGRVLPGIRVLIDTSAGTNGVDGEIVVYGPNVMVGYHDRPEENAKVLTPDGGLRTGDLGHLDADGFLWVTGRIKEQYKLDNGKYVMPAPLEEDLKLSPYISNVMLYGDGKPYNVALVVVDEKAVRKWAEGAGVALGADVTTAPEVRALVAEEIERHGNGFKGFEKPREIALVTEDFGIGNGLLTPTLKLKRRDVLKKYGALIDELYRRSNGDAPESSAAVKDARK